VALRAGLDPVVGMDLRGRVVDSLDFVAAVAVEALGRVGVSQRGDAAVESVLVGLELLVVAAAAIGGDGQFEGIAGGVADGVGRVAVGAHRRLSQHVLGVLLAMDRTLVGVELLGVAGAAQARDAQTPLGVFGRVLGRYVEAVDVVAVIALGFRFGLVLGTGPGMERFPVGFDVLGDDAQARPVGGPAVLFRQLPQFHVAVGAIDLLQRLRRVLGVDVAFFRVVLDVRVAGHALHQGMHALAVLLGRDALQCMGLALGVLDFQLGLLGVVAAQAGRVVEACGGRSGLFCGLDVQSAKAHESGEQPA